MSETKKPEVGTIAWQDLTVENATEIGQFYAEVVGWKAEPVDMGGYSDFTMTTPVSGQPVGGVCHARGVNQGLPPVWMICLPVGDLTQSLARVQVNGGEVVEARKGSDGEFAYAAIRDPVGACLALVPG